MFWSNSAGSSEKDSARLPRFLEETLVQQWTPQKLRNDGPPNDAGRRSGFQTCKCHMFLFFLVMLQ